MKEEWIRYFLAYAKTPEFRRKVKQTREFLDRELTGKKAYLAFSGGKDSTILLHMVGKRVTVVYWYAGRYYIPDDLHEEILQIAREYGREVREYTSREYEIKKRNAINVKGKVFLGVVVPELAKEFDVAIVGLRAEESVKRKLKRKVETVKGIRTIYPLLDWTWKDVWAYIVSNNVRYISYYDRYGDVLGFDKVRFCSLFYPGFDRFGAQNVDGVLSWRFKNIETAKYDQSH